MPLILSIETSTKACSIAIHQTKELLAHSALYMGQSHSEMLTVMIQNLLQTCKLQLKDLQAIAIAKGPGSYTGLRIGTATAKGLCYALDIPLLAVNTLEAMAWYLQTNTLGDFLFCPMIDARRMEVYCAVLNRNLEFIEETQAKIIDESAFSDLLKEKQMLFFGDGAAKCKELLGSSKNAFFIDNFQPSAIAVGYFALQKFEKQAFEDVAYFEPFYLKDFVGKKLPFQEKKTIS